jgi:RNA polymerase sigma-70 factor (ECF subfamily)
VVSHQAKDRVGQRQLSGKARANGTLIEFCERIEPSAEHLEDLDTSRLVTRVQSGDKDAFATLYTRYFDRVFGYLRVLLNDGHEAEDAAQQVFLHLLEKLPQYERREQPFRAWLFVVVRNYALTQLRKGGRLVSEDPEDIDRRREQSTADEPSLNALDWISDRDLLLFVERLPLAQRQVLLLRYMLDLTDVQTAAILDRSREDVRAIQYRAMSFLRDRLAAVGRGPKRRARERMLRCPNQAFVLRERRFSLIR